MSAPARAPGRRLTSGAPPDTDASAADLPSLATPGKADAPQPPPPSLLDARARGADDGPGATTSKGAAAGGNGGGGGAAAAAVAADAGGGGGGGGSGDLGARRAYKARFQEGVALFNAKPNKGRRRGGAGGRGGPCCV